jgi:hypothetical protein
MGDLDISLLHSLESALPDTLWLVRMTHTNDFHVIEPDDDDPEEMRIRGLLASSDALYIISFMIFLMRKQGILPVDSDIVAGMDVARKTFKIEAYDRTSVENIAKSCNCQTIAVIDETGCLALHPV